MWPFKADEMVEKPADKPKALHMFTHTHTGAQTQIVISIIHHQSEKSIAFRSTATCSHDYDC